MNNQSAYNCDLEMLQVIQKGFECVAMVRGYMDQPQTVAVTVQFDENLITRDQAFKALHALCINLFGAIEESIIYGWLEPLPSIRMIFIQKTLTDGPELN